MNLKLFVLISLSILTNAQTEINLADNWTLINSNTKINILNLSLPISVTTALRNQQLIDDPLFRYNDVKLRWIANDDNWIFENKFQLDKSIDLNNSIINLQFESIDTIASVYLNNQFILYSSNQFLKYELFNINSHLLQSEINVLQIKFLSPTKQANYLSKIYPYYLPVECPLDVQSGECHVNMLRKQQCSFSWDWGPAFAPIGINGNVKLKVIDNFDFNFTVLVNNPNKTDLNKWLIEIDLRLIKFKPSNQALISIKIDELFFEYKKTINVANIKNEINLKIDINGEYGIKYWWPNGYGDQKLYNLTIEIKSNSFKVKQCKLIGFRSIELVQEPIKYQNGTQNGLSFYFKINQVPIFLKGSNWIPANSFQELVSESHLTWLLKSAKEANMNVLRVWGGGIYEQEKFYDLANQYGILIWQDFMFACSLYPTNEEFLTNVISEVVYQINRLKHHPSIIIWSGNNENEAAISTNWYDTDKDKQLYENDYRKLYIDTVMSIVTTMDKSRPFLSSSPTNGIETINENWLAKNPYDLNYGDLHFYDYKMNGWEASSFPLPRFMSEFGIQSLPSYSTLSDAYSMPEDADMFSDLNQHRQHHTDGNQQIIDEIQNNLKLPHSNDSVENFKSIIYLSQINQAMSLKTGTEFFRRNKNRIDPKTGNGMCMGTMYWQFNDVWQAPTWSTIEFSCKWKLAHYFIRNSYADLLISPVINETHVSVHAVSDINSIVINNFTLKIFSFDSFTEKLKQNYSFQLKPLDSNEVLAFPLDFILNKTNCNSMKCLVEISSMNYRNFIFFNNKIDPIDLKRSNVKINKIEQINSSLFSIELNSDIIALFVYLDMNTTLFYGKFSDNGFHMTSPNLLITFEVYNNNNIQVNDIEKYLSVTSLDNIYS